jgi:uncharacterized membrane protein
VKDEKRVDEHHSTIPPVQVKPEQLLNTLHSAEAHFAQKLTDFSGSMTFVYMHAIWFGIWIALNQGFLKPLVHPFDPFPYGLLTMVVSLEAIFLSTFIMVAQNRQALVDTYRELEEDIEQEEDEKEQEALEQDVEEIQKDIDDIKEAMLFIQQKLTNVEKLRSQGTPSK